MIRKILPVLLVLVGLGGGVGAGLALRPAPAEKGTTQAEKPENAAQRDEAENDLSGEGRGADKDRIDDSQMAYVKLNNQFVVPVVKDELVESLVVMSLSIEVEPGLTASVYEREPKLRDGLLQVLFDHANMGGFEGEFTNSNNMDVLRGALNEVAQSVLGTGVRSILITDLARQDV